MRVWLSSHQLDDPQLETQAVQGDRPDRAHGPHEVLRHILDPLDGGKEGESGAPLMPRMSAHLFLHDTCLATIVGPAGSGKTTAALAYASMMKGAYDVVWLLHADSERALRESFFRMAEDIADHEARPGVMSPEQDQNSERDKISSTGATEQVVSETLAWLGAASRLNRSWSEEAEVRRRRWLLIYDDVQDWELVDRYWPRANRRTSSIDSFLQRGDTNSIIVLSEVPIVPGDLSQQDEPFSTPDLDLGVGRGNASMEALMLSIKRLVFAEGGVATNDADQGNRRAIAALGEDEDRETKSGAKKRGSLMSNMFSRIGSFSIKVKEDKGHMQVANSAHLAYSTSDEPFHALNPNEIGLLRRIQPPYPIIFEVACGLMFVGGIDPDSLNGSRVIEHSVEYLRSACPIALELLEALSILHADRISLSLMDAIGDCLHKSMGAESPSPNDIRKRLRQLRLIKRSIEEGQEDLIITIHPLVQSHIRSQITATSDVLEAALSGLDKEWILDPDVKRGPLLWLGVRDLLPHIESVRDFAYKNNIKNLTLARLIDGYGRYLWSQDEELLDLAQSRVEEAFSLRRELLQGDNHRELASSLHQIGIIHHDRGRLDDALGCFQDAIDIIQRLPNEGPRELFYGNVCNSMGLLLHDRGDLSGALRYYDKSLEIFREELGASDENIAATLNNKGLVYRDLGDVSQALVCLEQAMEADNRRKTSGGIGATSMDELEEAALEQQVTILRRRSHVGDVRHQARSDSFS